PPGAGAAGPSSPAPLATYAVLPQAGLATLVQPVVPARRWTWPQALPRGLQPAGRALAALAHLGHLAVSVRQRGILLRVALTALILHRCLPPARREGDPAMDTWGEWWAGLKVVVQASERREMRYRLTLALQDVVHDPGGRWRQALPTELHLHGLKTVDPGASWGELWDWGLQRLGWRWRGRTGPAPRLRPSYLEQVTQLQVRLTDAGGRLQADTRRWPMDLRQMLGELPLRLTGGGDLPSALLALAAYPGVFGRLLVKTRLIDFRLPVRSGRPQRDGASTDELTLRVWQDGREHRLIPRTYKLEVPLGLSSSDPPGQDLRRRIALRLHRYRAQPDRPPTVQAGHWQDQPVRRVRSVLLVHAFGQSGRSFTLDSAPQSLAGTLVESGYEVWVLDHRLSTRLPAHHLPSTIDQIARYDLPAAVRHVRQVLARELGDGPGQAPLQVFAIAQCIGAAASAMALLAGRLQPPGQPPALAGLVISQTHPHCVASPLTRARTWLPAFLRDTLRLPRVPFAVRDGAESGLLAMADRLFSALPIAPQEQCPARAEGDHDEDDCATCRRIRYIEAPLFKHRNLAYATHRDLPRLFGDANLRLFAHAARCTEAEHLVNEDGAPAYVSDRQVLRHFRLPLIFLHGQENELFDVESARRSAAHYARVHPELADLVARALGQPEGPQHPARAAFIVPGYGHLDVLIGQQARADVFEPLVRALDHLGTQDVPRPRPHRLGATLRLPLDGPCLGGLRREAGRLHLELAFRVDDRFSDGQRGPQAAAGDRTWAWVRSHPGGLGDPLAAGLHALALEDCPALTGDLGGQQPSWRRDVAQRRVASGALALPTAGLADRGGLALEAFTVHEVIVGDGAPWPADVLPCPPGLDLAQPGPALAAWLEALWQGRRRRLQDLAEEDRPHQRTASILRLRPEHPEQRLAQLAPAVLQPWLRPEDDGTCHLAVGSCRYPGFAVDAARVDTWLADLEQAQREGAAAPALALLLGDQIYADATAGFADALSPVERYWDRYRQAFSRRRPDPLGGPRPAGLGDWLAGLPSLLVPDDHEFIDNHPDGAPLVKAPPAHHRRAQGVTRAVAHQALRAYQFAHTRGWQVADGAWQLSLGPVRLLVLDTRSHRRPATPDGDPGALFSPGQWDAVTRWLAEAPRTGQLQVLATGSVLLPGLWRHTPMQAGQVDTLQARPAERYRLLQALAQAHAQSLGAARFLLLSGDYHLCAAARLQRQGMPLGACLVVPPLFAPLPFADARAEDLHWQEELPDGLALEPLEVRRGSGLGRLSVQRCEGGYQVRFRARLRRLELFDDPQAVQEVDWTLTL
ncbi:alkaline phosphatase D family protein, partial [Ideonella livida]